MKRIKSNQFVLADGLFAGYLYFQDGKILQLTQEELPVEKEYDLTDCYVSAGFIDLHTHGGGGHPFEGTVEDVIEGCAFHLKHGTTAVCPTIAAAPIAEMAQAAKNVEAAMRDPRVKGTILGSHLEGPYLSAAQCGAQCPRHITPPIEADYLPILEGCKSIVRWSYAPEYDEDARFAKALKDHGVVAAAGHTDAVYAEMKQAMEQGCNLVTHLYSCTSTVTRDHGFRRLGVIETAYLEDTLFVEIICDGKHLPPELIRLIYKLKGRERIALITDSLSLAGTEAKEGILQDTAYVIEDGVCKLLDRSACAGSIATADRLVRVAVKEAG
ncbi:MAG: amidohydrolase family protein, partial [Clostridia bacterium]|nr:amidohydrolase family protein [Clostridia bacterium]